MKDPFHPVEHAILCDYFGIPRPVALAGLSIDSCSDDDETEQPLGPILVEPAEHGVFSDLGLDNAVARIVLVGVQDQLPHWIAFGRGGQVVRGRDPWRRKATGVALLPRFLFEINWGDSAPGISWPERYHYCAIPGYDRSVVTVSVDSPESHGYTDFAIDWFPDAEPWRVACRRIVTGWWRRTLEWEQEPWCCRRLKTDPLVRVLPIQN